MGDTIVLAGALAQQPGRGGHTWVFLQYLLGWRRLGWDVLFLDRLDPSMLGNGHGAADVARSPQLAYLRSVMERFGLGESWALVDGSTGATHGLDRAEALERVRRSAALVNVMGYLDDDELLGAAPLRVFLDIDPGFPQMWRELDLADPFAGHDAFVTIGENIGSEGCAIPTCGLDWITTPQPVVLEEWPFSPPGEGPLTTVGSWRGAYGPVEYEGATYGLRVHEFRRFLDLPRLTGASFEVALDIDEADAADLERLRDGGWELVDPADAARDPDAYRRFIRSSAGELMVAKEMYVKSRSGWMSDRSICYLASGRPVLAQDTGLRDRYGGRDGLLLYSTLEEARDAVAELSAAPERHARGARQLAEERFDSDRVLAQLLSRLGPA